MTPIEEIKQRLEIVSVVSGYVSLTKAGRNFKARCPFHSERTPSFYVFPDGQNWRCFGACATGGDIFSFVMRQEGIEFGDALRLLAERAGVPLQETARAPEEDQRLARLSEVNQAAAFFYHDLLNNSPDAAEARGYVERRGLSRETVQDFLLGYSPNRWDGLKNHLEGRGFSVAEMVDAGLLTEGESGRYDRFRGRLMFPIRGTDWVVIGFGARELDGSNPKYLNSPQTPLFDKSATLYALDRARSAIRLQKQAVIVEGYMDVIMAHQNGFTNVVAAMGTSLTEKQVGILARLTANFVLALDADAAGQTATLRGLEVAPDAMGEEATARPAWQGKVRRRQVDGRQVFYGLPTGAANIVAKRKGEIKVVELPRGQDPDDVIRENPAHWQELIAQSVPMMDFLFKSIQQRYDLTSPRGKDEAAKEVLPFIAELPSPIEQAHYLQRLATLIGVDEGTLQAAMPRKGRRGNAERAGAGAADTPQPVEQSEVLEDHCLALLFRFDFLRPQAVSLRPEHFHSTEVRELFRAWQAGVAENYEETVDQTLTSRLLEIREKPLPPLTERMAQAALTQCIDRLEQRRLLELKSQHRLRLAQEESGHGFEDPDTLVVEILEQEVVVNRQLDELMKRKRARPVESSLEGSAL